MLIKRGNATIVQVFEEKKDISSEFDRDSIKIPEESFVSNVEEKGKNSNIVKNSESN